MDIDIKEFAILRCLIVYDYKETFSSPDEITRLAGVLGQSLGYEVWTFQNLDEADFLQAHGLADSIENEGEQRPALWLVYSGAGTSAVTKGRMRLISTILSDRGVRPSKEDSLMTFIDSPGGSQISSYCLEQLGLDTDTTTTADFWVSPPQGSHVPPIPLARGAIVSKFRSVKAPEAKPPTSDFPLAVHLHHVLHYQSENWLRQRVKQPLLVHDLLKELKQWLPSQCNGLFDVADWQEFPLALPCVSDASKQDHWTALDPLHSGPVHCARERSYRRILFLGSIFEDAEKEMVDELRALTAVMKTCYYAEVTMLTLRPNTPAGDFQEQMRQFAEVHHPDEDTLVISYFTGHGFWRNDGVFLVSGSASKEFQFRNVIKHLRRLPCDTLQVIDSCHSGSVTLSYKGPQDCKPSREVIVACGASETTYGLGEALVEILACNARCENATNSLTLVSEAAEMDVIARAEGKMYMLRPILYTNKPNSLLPIQPCIDALWRYCDNRSADVTGIYDGAHYAGNVVVVEFTQNREEVALSTRREHWFIMDRDATVDHVRYKYVFSSNDKELIAKRKEDWLKQRHVYPALDVPLNVLQRTPGGLVVFEAFDRWIHAASLESWKVNDEYAWPSDHEEDEYVPEDN